MKSYKASYFKAHFGAVLDRAGLEPVRIERRGREPSVVIPESKYRALRGQILTGSERPETALSRLKDLALGPEADLGSLPGEPRAAAILQKHS
jgi:PHD/YefM family antitoxin component YafN of YafNO toxin-antitoxin module